MILPPFPDDLVEQPDKEKAILFLLSLRLPSRFGGYWLSRWAARTGVAVTPADYRRVRSDLPPLPRG